MVKVNASSVEITLAEIDICLGCGSLMFFIRDNMVSINIHESVVLFKELLELRAVHFLLVERVTEGGIGLEYISQVVELIMTKDPVHVAHLLYFFHLSCF